MNHAHVHYKLYERLDGRSERLVERVGSGSIVKRFDGTPLPERPTDVVCPHFLELKWAYGCPYRCAWCYLQGTLRLLATRTRPVVKDFARIEDHLSSFFHATCDGNGEGADDYPAELLNTGELADSLMWERNGSPFSRFIMETFDTQAKHCALFLSKSDAVDNILKIESELLIPSFTLNGVKISRRWERGAPSPDQRIKAAAALARCGFHVRIRIDPLVPVPNWSEEYEALLDRLFGCFIPDRITFGSLRGLQSTINNAHDRSWTSYLGERSNWGGKVLSAARIAMYRHLIDYLRDIYGFSRVALCKETLAAWEALGLDYRQISCNCTV